MDFWRRFYLVKLEGLAQGLGNMLGNKYTISSLYKAPNWIKFYLEKLVVWNERNQGRLYKYILIHCKKHTTWISLSNHHDYYNSLLRCYVYVLNSARFRVKTNYQYSTKGRLGRRLEIISSHYHLLWYNDLRSYMLMRIVGKVHRYC